MNFRLIHLAPKRMLFNICIQIALNVHTNEIIDIIMILNLLLQEQELIPVSLGIVSLRHFIDKDASLI